jgi:hypothetical protein
MSCAHVACWWLRQLHDKLVPKPLGCYVSVPQHPDSCACSLQWCLMLTMADFALCVQASARNASVELHPMTAVQSASVQLRLRLPLHQVCRHL